ncbi:hypothetical protein BKA56DRAFT_676449 [Ilyonectria sp. MPI-CAGE-AT-0026]|nr:hypothetical protein BKA56DRAFT_676449 [Ilyonectria sp. MPI-CAGE-AT-0026]
MSSSNVDGINTSTSNTSSPIMDGTAFTFRVRPPENVASSSSNVAGPSNPVQEDETTVKKAVYPHLHLGHYCALRAHCAQMFQRVDQVVVSLDRSTLLKSLVAHPGPPEKSNDSHYKMDTPSPGITDNLLEPPECISGLELIDSQPRMRQGLWQLLTWSAPWRDAPMQFFRTESRLSPVLANIGWRRGQGRPSPHRLPYGDEPKSADEVALPPFIRITIDAYGICQIQRIAKPNRKDSLTAKRTDNKAFIVIEAAVYAKQVEMQFMNGLARMETIDGSPRFQTWDTPTPPFTFNGTRFIYPGCTTFENEIDPRCRFFSIKFKDTVGITFVYHPSMDLVDMQQHRKEGPGWYFQPLLDYPADSLVCV